VRLVAETLLEFSFGVLLPEVDVDRLSMAHLNERTGARVNRIPLAAAQQPLQRLHAGIAVAMTKLSEC
jgi:hypothetical protein